MDYFMPSYIRRRLLVFAFDKLEFIDASKFDLDSLSLNLGRRSQVELKNVPIKVKTLAEKANLPPSIQIEHASIRLLRVTVPRDIHISGIEVEIDGVEGEVKIQQEGAEAAQKHPSHAAPSHADKANRPRSSRYTTHDPGGGHNLELSRVLPSSRHLAASFLESEPAEEKQELQDVVDSRTQQLEDSLSGYENELGLGLPTGLTLPTFVAGFFQGVADRLSVEVKNVALKITFSTSHRRADECEEACMVLSLQQLHYGATSQAPEDVTKSRPSKVLSLQDIQVHLEADPEAFAHPSSPRLARSASKSSASVFSGSSNHSRHSGEHDPGFVSTSLPLREHRTLHHTLVASESSEEEDSGQSTPDAVGSQNSSSIKPEDVIHRVESESPYSADDDSQSHQSQSSMAESSSGPDGTAQHGASALAESSLFTTDEAASLYMSALSQGHRPDDRSRAMPGAWQETSETSEADAGSQASPADDPAAKLQASKVLDDRVVAETVPAEVPGTPQDPIESAVEENTTAADEDRRWIRLAFLDRLKLVMPQVIEHQSTTAPSELVQTLSAPATSGASVSKSVFTGSARKPEEDQAEGAEAPQHAAETEIQMGSLALQIDLDVCKSLVRIVNNLSKTLAGGLSHDPEKAAARSDAQLWGLGAQVRDITLDFHEIGSMPVGNIAPHRGQHQSPPGQALLSLVLNSAAYSEELQGQKLTVFKITLRHMAKDVLWFVDNVSLRDSLAGSALMRPDDLTIIVGNRIEVQTKPMHLVLDLLILDDVLSRSGGLSSLIDLGNPIVSNQATPGTQPQKRRPKTPIRAVRFDTSHTRTKSSSDESRAGSKINIRIGGTIIDILGSEASLQMKTSAIKTALRDGSVRVVIDGAMLDGPRLHNQTTSPPVTTKLKGLMLHYLDTPDEADLDRLLTLIAPSHDKYDNDDDIMVDTLLRQRRKGGVLRLELEDVLVNARGLEWQQQLSRIADELAKLSSVAKYLPEDDRPGILTFGLVKKVDLGCTPDDKFGPLRLRAELLEGAYITVPSLAAAQISMWSLVRTRQDILIGQVLAQSDSAFGPPMLMCRFIADEMEPTVRLKLSNTCVEYRVSSLVDLTHLAKRLGRGLDADQFEALMPSSSPVSSRSSDFSDLARKIKVSVAIRDCAAALYPTDSPAKGLFLLTNAGIAYETKKWGSNLEVDLQKASILLVNNSKFLGQNSENEDHKLYFDQNDQLQQLVKSGFVVAGTISAASATVKIIDHSSTHGQQFDVEFRNSLLFLETCADSTQTLVQILNGLAPPSAPSTVAKYRTEIIPLDDMLASFSGNAYVSEKGPELGLDASRLSEEASVKEDEGDAEGDSFAAVEDMFGDNAPDVEELQGSYSASGDTTPPVSVHVMPVDVEAPDEPGLAQSMVAHSMLDFRSDHFSRETSGGGTADRWNYEKGTYDVRDQDIFDNSPLKVHLKDVHVIWNLFDGYDWQSTRDTISQAVRDVEAKAQARRRRSGTRSPVSEEEDESVIGDTLFNSIYISIPAHKDPRELATAINHDIDDMVSETGSYATQTTITQATARRQSSHGPRPKKLKLNRSKQHKISFELQGVSADFVAFPPGIGEVQSSCDIRVGKLEIFDHIPTSTWKKFATYMYDAGEREMDTSQVHIEIVDVKPIPDLSATELVLKVTLLPLRLHVDQDALDFMSRFFEFKDDSLPPPSSPPSAPPFLQRVEVNPVRVRLDYKPKKVDYAGIRSGRTTEFMNFFVLDRADMILRRVVLRGVPSFERMGIMLNDIWMPDVKQNQLPTVLAGLAPVRPLVDVASGVQKLISVPIQEYRKDGRVVRSIQKGAVAFAKTTATELVNLGAKLAIGTQAVLQNAEGLLVNTGQPENPDDEATKQISLYADQPVGIVQGLRGAYAGLEKDLLLARDAVVAVPGEVMASESATRAAKAVLKQSPTIILRPAIGASRAVGQTLLGAGNTLDRRNLRRMEDKYKRH